MTGGIFQLVAKGFDDIYLTDFPQVTLFKCVYRRIAAYSIYDDEILIKSRGNFSSTTTVKLENKADLLHKIYVVIDIPSINFNQKTTSDTSKYAWVKNLGNKLIKNVSIKIGGQLIDSHSSELSYFINKIYKNSNHNRGLDILIGNTPDMYENNTYKIGNTLYIPLQFWFNRHAGNALPLLCILYSDIELVIEMNNLSDVITSDKNATIGKKLKIKTKLYVQYIYLDEEERYRMAQAKLEYLIESFNYSGLKIYTPQTLISTGDAQIVSMNKDYITSDLTNIQLSPEIKYDIYLNDPTKYLIWYVKIIDTSTQQSSDISDWNKFGYMVRDSSGNLTNIQTIFSSISIQMNGTNRENPKNEYIYSYVIPHSKSLPSLDQGEYFYSFALYPTLLQPSGTANFSELSNASITMILSKTVANLIKDNPNIEIRVELWGCAYKILRVFSGFAALAFYR